ncbi:MATE family efflux transporter [Sellimonas caecigallum]|uniref:Probable multidrug resistance protein NorM n=1 Tax=Sellimonas caecigallum TaxID=2592333 RepID=A0ABS7L3I9_9FIRM|nr:MATE family efflux transporter [Sellimonas caecigallum]MBY0757527.1 MATE family efflux transporter [Sellimonas caecigallum]
METSKTLMTEGPIWKKIIFFAIPIFLGNLFQQMYNTADSLIVGNFLGSNALAAVSSSGNLIYLMIGFFNGIAIGAGVVIARYYGARDEVSVEQAVHTTVAFGLVASAVLTIVGVFFAPQILIWMKTPEDVLPESVSYFRVYFMGSTGFVMYNIFVGILQAVGDSKHPLYYLILSSVINVVLDLVFIAGFDMGVGSAAFATAISQFVSAFLCMTQLMRSKEEYKLQWRRVRFDREMLGQIIRFGLPSGFQNSIIAIANVVVQSNINSFGEMAMAGCGAYSKIEGFGFLPITSFTLALTTFVGQNLGAKDYDRAKKGAKFGMFCAMGIAEVIGIVIFIFAPVFTAAFDSTPEVIRFGVERARTAALFYFLLAFSHSVAAILRGAGKAVVPMVIMMIFWCVVRVAFLTGAGMFISSIAIVYWVYPLTWTLSSVAFLIYYKKADWLHSFS